MDLDDELRRLFANVDDQLDVPVRPDADQVIVAGARRVRRRRIATATAGGAAAVVALVVGGIAFAGARPEAMPPAAERTTSAATPAPTTISSTGSVPSYTAPVPPAAAETQESNPGTVTQPPPEVDQPPEVTGAEIGPVGFRDLRLGMTYEDALATGQVRGDPPVVGAGCTTNDIVAGESVLGHANFSEANELQTINPTVDVHTPEGVSIGWTIPEVKAVYADLNEQVEEAGGADFVAVPGNRSAYYRLRFSDGLLAGITLELVTQPCYG